jgi:hypothetical protein
MAEETPREKYERLQSVIQSEILTAYPNPTRKDCPGDAVVKQVAERKELTTDEPWEHITHCSPCYTEFLAYKESFREREKRRKKWFRYQMVAAACLVIAAGMVPLIWNRLDQGRVYNAEFDLRHRLLFRGGSDPDHPTQLNPPLTLRRGHVHLKIDLPETWQPGKYDVMFLDQSKHKAVFAATGNAALRGPSAILTIDALVDVSPGEYTISIRREGSGWRGFPVRVTKKGDVANN